MTPLQALKELQKSFQSQKEYCERQFNRASSHPTDACSIDTRISVYGEVLEEVNELLKKVEATS